MAPVRIVPAGCGFMGLAGLNDTGFPPWPSGCGDGYGVTWGKFVPDGGELTGGSRSSPVVGPS